MDKPKFKSNGPIEVDQETGAITKTGDFSGTLNSLVGPSAHVSEEMINLAKTDDAWHFASNLNALMRLGYCRKCGLVPEGCKREGCGPNVGVSRAEKG